MAKTQKELAARLQARMPGVRYLVLLNIVSLVAIVGMAYTATTIHNSQNVYVSPECRAQYSISVASDSSGASPLSADCKQRVERSFDENDRQDVLLKGFIGSIFILIISILGYPRWYRSYAEAVSRLTTGKVSQGGALAYLMSGTVGMVLLQRIYNQLPRD
ncbi:MAG TPA: hypothetical protein VF401_03105 [Candidatus Saccharimonadales bacterium]